MRLKKSAASTDREEIQGLQIYRHRRWLQGIGMMEEHVDTHHPHSLLQAILALATVHL